ncbi:MAG: hypothetical protein ACFFDK_15355 [Promethearchaeota archaeon]
MGFIQISEKDLKNSPSGLLAINIVKDIICSHSFIIYVDKNLEIRDYFVVDFNIEIPELSDSEPIQELETFEKDIMEFDLIKLYIPAKQFTYILKSIFSKQNIILIFDDHFLHDPFHNFFEMITQNSFEINITIFSKEEYKANKKKNKDSMVFESISIHRNNKNLINPKKLDVEKYIVNKFLTQSDMKFSYIFLKNEILKAYKLSKSIAYFIKNNQGKGKNINILLVKNQLENEYKLKINREYLSFLIEIVRDYFKVDAPSYCDSFIKSL